MNSQSAPTAYAPLRAVDSSPVPGIIERIGSAQNETHELISTLKARLSFVTEPEPDAPHKGEVSPSHSTELMSALQERLDHANGLNARLRRLLDSIVL